jgi:hypothetical protein
MKKFKSLKALGFVEVVIAIVVVGISSAVFLTMSGRALRELVQSERIEYMGRVAKDGVIIAQQIANLQKGARPDEEFFPSDSNFCYVPIREGIDQYTFLKEGEQFEAILENSPQEIIRTWAIEHGQYADFNGSTSSPDYFLIMCITNIQPTEWANVYFWIGDIRVAGQQTSDTDMKDLKYYAIIDL